MNLCQRTQGCMKAENHTGFCSGHRGFKRKNTAAYGGGVDEFGAAPRRRKSVAASAKARAGPVSHQEGVTILLALALLAYVRGGGFKESVNAKVFTL